MRLLLVDDDTKAAAFLSRGLREEGFVVDTAHSGAIGDEMASVNNYDVIVLDWLLPAKDGLSICRDLRERGITTPILMATARDAVTDRVAGLNSGADDYLTKPFEFAELLARIRALIRRQEAGRSRVLTLADLVLDPVTQRVTRGGVDIDLTQKEYSILELLMHHAGQVVTRSRIAESVWESEVDDLANLLDVHMSRLRKKVDEGSSVTLIHTVRGRGFRLAMRED
jgi:DNA-binding response OmpR family regulator